MLGEQDLNPFGFHATTPGRRMPSMMSPTVVLRDGRLELGLGSGGSNRIRSAILQAIVRMLGDGLDGSASGRRRRGVHFEAGVVHAEPGVDRGRLERLAAAGHEVVRWREPEPVLRRRPRGRPRAATGGVAGAGDPRRGGAVVTV